MTFMPSPTRCSREHAGNHRNGDPAQHNARFHWALMPLVFVDMCDGVARVPVPLWAPSPRPLGVDSARFRKYIGHPTRTGWRRPAHEGDKQVNETERHRRSTGAGTSAAWAERRSCHAGNQVNEYRRQPRRAGAEVENVLRHKKPRFSRRSCLWSRTAFMSHGSGDGAVTRWSQTASSRPQPASDVRRFLARALCRSLCPALLSGSWP